MNGEWQVPAGTRYVEYVESTTRHITLTLETADSYRIVYYWYDDGDIYDLEILNISEVDNVYNYALWRLENLMNGVLIDESAKYRAV
jgi:hypothetical protein